MKILYRKRFLKDLARIPSEIRGEIERFVFETLPPAGSLAELGSVERMKGHPTCYKARFGSYRVGLRREGEAVICERVLHRREIYRNFP